MGGHISRATNSELGRKEELSWEGREGKVGRQACSELERKRIEGRRKVGR